MKNLLTFITMLILTATVSYAQTARVQVIHNAADPLLATVDVEINGQLLGALDDFTFRSATPYVTLPSGAPVAITLKTADGVTTLGTVNLDSLENGETYTIIANGVAVPGSFDANPDGVATGFGLFIFPGTRETGQNGATTTDVLVFHGSTDAPSVDVQARGIATVVNNLSYTGAQGYLPLPVGTYTLDVADSTGSTVVASYIADISTLGGGAATVFASGFFNPGQGDAFGLWVALPDGTTFPLPAEQVAGPSGTARVQVIHNAADPAAATVDVTITADTASIALNDFAFRSATPYVDVPSGVPVTIEVKTGDGSATIATFNLDSVAANTTYVVVANGVAAPGSFTANPDGESIAFDLYISGIGQEAAATGTMTDLLFFHGATDAPTVDVVANSAVTLTDDIKYGTFDGYAAVDPLSYSVAVTTSDQATTVVEYTADLTTLTGGAAVVFASGFLDGTQGEAFGVWVALPDGTTFALPTIVGIDELVFGRDLNIFPNPATSRVRVDFNLEEALDIQYQLISSTGQVVDGADLGVMNAGRNYIDLNVDDLSTGVYLVRLTIGNETNVTRPIIVE